jgi:hypothetical protein
MEYSLAGRSRNTARLPFKMVHLCLPAREGAPWPRREPATYRKPSENQRGRRNIILFFIEIVDFRGAGTVSCAVYVVKKAQVCP